MKNGYKKLRYWLGQRRKGIILIILFAGLLSVTANTAYHKGQEQGKKSISRSSSAAPSIKNLPSKLKEQRTKSTNLSPIPSIANSGFFRLTGVVQKATTAAITIKLADGSLVSLAIKANQTYLSNGSQAPISGIKKNTTVSVAGTIGTKGTFTANALQVK